MNIIEKAISDWWNDYCRNTWKTDFADPQIRNNLLLELAQRIMSESKLGATQTYPQGKLGEDDEGELKIAIAADKINNTVAIDFGKPVKWLAFDRETALGMAESLIEKAGELR